MTHARSCKPGCTRCCGIVPWSPSQWEKVKDHPAAAGVALVEFGSVQIPGRDGQILGDCPFASEKGCAVYELRPPICRLFGNVKDPLLRCPVEGGYAPPHWLKESDIKRILGEGETP